MDVGAEAGGLVVAIGAAKAGKKVVLIDADMRKPRVHQIMGLPNRDGLSEFFMRETRDLRDVIHHWEGEDLDVLTSGKVPPNPAELLGSERMSKLLDMFKGKYDFVVIDSPPIGVVTDPTVLSARVDGTLLVVEPKKTRLGAAVQAVEQLRRADANVIGMVFNNVPIGRADYYTGHSNGYYYYQYAYSYTESEDGKEPEEYSSRKIRKEKA